MTTAENKALVRRCWEACFNQGNLAVADALVASDYLWHAPEREVHGRESIKEMIRTYRAAFPDIYYPFQDQIAEADKVVSRSTRETISCHGSGCPASLRTACASWAYSDKSAVLRNDRRYIPAVSFSTTDAHV